MSEFDELIKKIDANGKKPTKAELTELIRTSLTQLNEIDGLYRKYFESNGADPSVLNDIESKVKEIKDQYAIIFPGGPGTPAISSEIETKYQEIKEYHKELLVGSAEEVSVKADIEDSQEKITAFYNQLFGKDPGQHKAKDIEDFYERLTSTDGIESETERISKLINDKYSELFEKNVKTKKSLIEELEDGISKADQYKKYIDDELQPLIDEKQSRIDDIDKDIKIKQGNVDALLSNATAKSLTQGFAESKAEYLNGVPKRYKKLASWKDAKGIFSNVGVFFYNVLLRYLPSLLNYILFITPLVAIVFIFTDKDLADIVLKSLSVDAANSFNRVEAIYAKTIISIPMIWIAWYGQRNISQRKRLREEYNHKYRVLQVYLMFLTGQETYTLSVENRDALEKIVLATVNDNPAQHLGKSETYMDNAKNSITELIPFIGNSKDKNN